MGSPSLSKFLSDADILEAQRAMRVWRQEPRRRVASDDGRCCTLDAVAAELHVSRERVRQIERSALRKLAAALRARGLTLGDLLP